MRNLEGAEIKPLSFVKYIKNNLRRSLSTLIALTLSIFMVITFQLVTFAVNEPARLADEGVTNNFTHVYPGDAGKIDTSIINQLYSSSSVERIMSVNFQNVDYNHFFGSCNAKLLFIKNEDMDYILKKLSLRLKEGRMPVSGKNEVLLDWRLANNKGKKVGDFIGSEVDSKEKIPGKYKIVGILEGECIIGISPVQESQWAGLKCLLIGPKNGQLVKLNEEFSNVSPEKAHFWGKKKADENYSKNAERVNVIFGIMSIAVIFVMAFALGNSSYAQYFSRRQEFGLLRAVGFSRAEILLRAAKEILLLNLVGFVMGISLTIVVGLVLRETFFNPHGYPFMLLQPDGVIKAVTIPICTALFGLIPVGWLLSKIDPMTVIEKFE